MKLEEALRVLDEVIKSLRENPGQFNIKVEVNTAGAVGIGGSGGPGIVGISNGGGTGFSATSSSPSQVSVNIARGEAGSRFGREMDELVQTLEGIKTEMQRADASADRANGLLKRLGSWVPNVVVAVVSELIKSAIVGA